MTYCQFSKTNKLHQYYHDYEYGFPTTNDNILLERLALEINQAGLSWDLMLKKRVAFNKAFKNFVVAKVARFNQADINRLLNDSTIVRNRLKITAVIHNAKLISTLQKDYGSFSAWLTFHSNERLKENDGVVSVDEEIKYWIKVFKKQGFKFVGGEIIKEFLQSVGYLPSPHDLACAINKQIFKARVLFIVSQIPKGQTMTYGEVAKRAGQPKSARAVGALMKQNQDKNIPCHRVVAKNGIGGYNGLRGKDKAVILSQEGAL